MTSRRRDAIVVGGGPNGLAAAAFLAEHGLDVLLVEAAERVGGGLASDELTLPGVTHDVGSAVHPLALASPYLRTLALSEHGVEWIHPEVPVAHPIDATRVAALHRSLDATAHGLGPDGDRYRRLLGPFVERWDALVREILAPVHLPRHPILLARFGIAGVRSAEGLLRARFETAEARALLAGCAAHSFLPLDRLASAAVGLVLTAAGHAVGWPIPRGGAGTVARALERCVRERGVTIETGRRIQRLEELPPARAVLLDLTPRQVMVVAADELPTRYLRRLAGYRYGPAAFKLDWALREPVPWIHEACARAGTVHVGGTLDAVATSERAPARGRVAEHPFVLFVQPSVFDPDRAPEGTHTAWAYCHVPNGFPGDATEAIEAQVERFAPGFRDVIVGRSVLTPARLESLNPNLVGGDINGGLQDLGQLFTRPVARWNPYRTPSPEIFLCSSSTPPGGGVHGMCGYHAARTALRTAFGITTPLP